MSDEEQEMSFTNKAFTLREGVRRAYSAVAERPQDEHPFPVGRDFALSLGYPDDWLASLPRVAVEAFAGVSNVAVFADLTEGITLLDLGCGAGLDLLLASRRVGPRGRVVGVDFSEAMLQRARQAVREAEARNVFLCQASVESLPLQDASIDTALVNGLFNLNPFRDVIFRELERVVRPGGVVYAAELILREPLPPEIRTNEINWFA